MTLTLSACTPRCNTSLGKEHHKPRARHCSRGTCTHAVCTAQHSSSTSTPSLQSTDRHKAHRPACRPTIGHSPTASTVPCIWAAQVMRCAVATHRHGSSLYDQTQQALAGCTLYTANTHIHHFDPPPCKFLSTHAHQQAHTSSTHPPTHQPTPPFRWSP
jgi:hypothetical protein